MPKKPRVLLYDIENAPMLVWTWEAYEANAIKVVQDWFMMSVAWKWQGEKTIHVRCLEDYKGYEKNKICDRALVQELRELMDEADLLVAHNGNSFDLKKTRARFVYHGMTPPEPSKLVDTYRIAKKEFKFSKNNLDHLAEYFDIGRKLPHTGFNMWEKCIAGDPKAWAMMRKYNKHDVHLLDGVYHRLRPWATNHPNLEHYTRSGGCPVCLGTNLKKTGFAYLTSGKKQRMTCQSCGHRSTTGKLMKDAA